MEDQKSEVIKQGFIVIIIFLLFQKSGIPGWAKQQLIGWRSPLCRWKVMSSNPTSAICNIKALLSKTLNCTCQLMKPNRTLKCLIRQNTSKRTVYGQKYVLCPYTFFCTIGLIFPVSTWHFHCAQSQVCKEFPNHWDEVERRLRARSYRPWMGMNPCSQVLTSGGKTS